MSENKEILKNLIRQNLLELFSKDVKNARNYELYLSVAHSLRSFFAKDWLDTKSRHRDNRTNYILSFEYLTGKSMERIARYLGLYDDFKESLFELGIDYRDILSQEVEPALGNGSMAISSYELLQAASANKLNSLGYGLRYRGGMFNQEIIHGAQIEGGEYWLSNDNPWEHIKGFSYDVKFKDFTVTAKAYDMPVLGKENGFINTFRLWSAEYQNGVDFESFSEGKLYEAFLLKNKTDSIVEFLYPESSSSFGTELRLYQEYFYASASIQDILRRYFSQDLTRTFENFEKFVNIEIHDIHPALAIAEFVRILCHNYKQSFEDSINLAQKVFSYVNFGVFPESFESWKLDEIESVCPIVLDSLRTIHDLNERENREKNQNYMPIIKDGRVSYFNLIAYTSKDIFALTKHHAENMSKFIRDEDIEKKVLNIDISNSNDNWLVENNRELTGLLNETLACDVKKFPEKKVNLINHLENLDFFTEFAKIKSEKKKKQASFIREKLDVVINPNSLFDMQMERMHEYKRQLLNALAIAGLYFKLKDQPNLDITERTYFFSGKAPKGYYIAKEIIKFINALAYMINRNLVIKDKIKIVFIPNLSMDYLKKSVQACDLYESLSYPDLEVGFGNSLKFLMNGTVNISSNQGTIANDLKNYREFSYSFEEKTSFKQSVESLYHSNEDIKYTIDNLLSLTWRDFPYDFRNIYNYLINTNDYYQVLANLTSYSKVHFKACEEFLNQEKWIKKSIKAIVYTSGYTMDKTIENLLWKKGKN